MNLSYCYKEKSQQNQTSFYSQLTDASQFGKKIGMIREKLKVSAPGRICLRGEHQDYFGLSILAGAIDLRLTITGRANNQDIIRLNLPDIDDYQEFPLNTELAYSQARDYLRSGLNIVYRLGYRFSQGWDGEITSTIPINSGTASSSAMVVAWVKFLLEACGSPEATDIEKIAELAFEAEVAEFKEPGGKMDHYSSAFGGIIFISFSQPLRYELFKSPLGEFVIADSRQRKDTTGTLAFIKNNVLSGVQQIQKKWPEFNLHSPLTPETIEEINRLDKDPRRLLLGTLLTRDLTLEGRKLFQNSPFDHQKFGQLLSEQHRILHEYHQISTPKIEAMLEAALEAGALGGKINGSGGGGCMFVYCPGKGKEVVEALKRLDTHPFIIRIDEGVKTEE